MFNAEKILKENFSDYEKQFNQQLEIVKPNLGELSNMFTLDAVKAECIKEINMMEPGKYTEAQREEMLGKMSTTGLVQRAIAAIYLEVK